MTAPEGKPSAAEQPNRPLTAREKAKANQVIVNDPLLGQVIGGHYEVLECIGKGGMSVVYKTRHQLINQFRAVKVLLPHRDSETDFLLRFQLEATAASRLDNKHIVRVHDFVAPEASAPYLVMDYAEGQALGDEIDKLGRLPVARALAIFVQILDAIGHTHARGVIHRDLKPDNILLVDDELEGPDFVKLIDFGIAKLTAADKFQPQGLTPTGEIFGSPQYMSPEQCAGLTMDVRSEIYSLGCILYEMVSGRAPLMGKSVLETLNMQAHTPPTPLAKLSMVPPLELPRGLDDILLRCLAKKPEDRFQTTEDLRRAVTALPNFNRRQRQSRFSSKPGIKAMSLAVLAIIISFWLGFGLAKMLPGGNQTAKDQVPTANQSVGQSAVWQGLYQSGQKALDDGDLAAASSKLEEALTMANGLDDGQKRAAATGIDLCTINLIKQFKNYGPNETESQVSLSESYPNNPWSTKISAIVEVLRSKPENAEQEKANFRSTIALLEDSHKGNLASLNELVKLALEKLPKYASLNKRDNLRLTLLIAGLEEEQGYWQRARALLKNQETQLASIGSADSLAAKFYLLNGRLALDENDLPEANAEAKKALFIYEENALDHTVDLLDVTLLRSDIAFAGQDQEGSLRLAKQALSSLDEVQASPRLEMLRSKLLTRLAYLDPEHYLSPALAQSQSNLAQEEGQAPKEVAQLVSALDSAYRLSKLQDSQAANSTRSKLWRAMALALSTGRIALASSLMQPLMLSYDTPLTQKDLFRLANNRLAIDETLAAAGNHNGPSLMQDYVIMAEALEDFSLGPLRNLKKARAYLDKATALYAIEANRNDHLTAARFYFYQARGAEERKGSTPALVHVLLIQAEKELERAKNHPLDKVADQYSAELAKKIKELNQECDRPAQH